MQPICRLAQLLQQSRGLSPANLLADLLGRNVFRQRNTLGAMPPAVLRSVKDVDGQPVREGDVVRVLGIPDLTGMRDPYRRETEAVFKRIVGTRTKVAGFDQFGCAILVFAISSGRLRGSHSVAIEPHLIRKVIGKKVGAHGS